MSVGELLKFTRYGPLLVPGGEDLISKFLANYGEWSFFETDFVGQQISVGAHILDVGAYVGTFSLGVSGRQPKKIVAVEPNVAVVGLLAENLRRNLPVDFEILNVIAGTPGRLLERPFIAQAGNLGSLTFVGESNENSEPISHCDVVKEIISLSDIRHEHGDFDFVKMDIEGAERVLLESDESWLRAARPTLWMECNETTESLRLFEYLNHIGYSVFYFSYPSFNPNNFLGNQDRIFPVAYEAGLLALESGRIAKMTPGQSLGGCSLSAIKDVDQLRRCLWETPRWGQERWSLLTHSGLLAECGRLILGQKYEKFLRC